LANISFRLFLPVFPGSITRAGQFSDWLKHRKVFYIKTPRREEARNTKQEFIVPSGLLCVAAALRLGVKNLDIERECVMAPEWKVSRLDWGTLNSPANITRKPDG
jgi:hypothetical protein